jgi:hypothetical protein
MKRVADATDPPVAIPVILVAVAVHLALFVPAIECGVTRIRKTPSMPLLLETYKNLGAVSYAVSKIH